jgi:ABC-type bacteriocin/lantibiotic exporter with double-glycine peptidase domain
MGLSWAMGFVVAAFLMMIVMKWSLVWVLLGLGMVACLWTFHRLKARA